MRSSFHVSRTLLAVSILTIVSVAGAFAFGVSDDAPIAEPDAKAPPNFGRLVVAPANLVFPLLNFSARKPPGPSRTRTFIIENLGRGTNTLVVTVGAISGTNASEFQISPPPGAYNFLPGRAAAMTFTVIYTPTTDGRAEAQLTISATDANGIRGVATRTMRLIGNARGPIASTSATATATATATASSSASASATATSTAAAVTGKNSADAPGLIANGTTVTAYLPLGSYGFTQANIAKSVIEGPAPSPSPVTITASHANSCAVASSGEAVCAEGDSQGFANFDLVPAGSATTAATIVPSTSQGSIDYLPGSCSGCGMIIDSALGTGSAGLAIMSASGGFFTLDLGNVAATPVAITTNPSEPPGPNFGYDSVHHRILNANYSLTSTTPPITSTAPHFQIIDISTPATPVVYDLNNDQTFFVPGTAGTTCTGNAMTDNDSQFPETSAYDAGTQIAYVSFHTPPDCENTPPDTIALFDMSQANFTPGTAGASGTWDTPGKQIQALNTDFSLNGIDVMSVEPTNHLAILAGGSTGFGAMQLPTTSGSGTPAITDWVSANMPNDPDSTPWNGWSLPNGVTTYVSPNTGKSMALMINALENGGGARTGIARYAALVDIQALLNQPRDQVGGHQVAGANDGQALVTAGVVTFILIQ